MDNSIVGQIVSSVLRGFATFFWIQPRQVQLAWGRFFGSILFRIGFRKKVVLQNLKIAFPQNEVQQNLLLRSSYAHLGNLLIEILYLLGPMKSFVEKYVDLQGLNHLEEAKKQGKGVIFLASHLGNWEVMAATGGVLAKTDLMLVTKHLKPEWLHQMIERSRSHCGVRATYEPKTLRDVLSHLKKNGTVGFVLDQYAGPPVGVRVSFFGLPVGTTQAVATLAKRTGAVVLPVENFRTPEGRWSIRIHPAVEWEKAEDPNLELALNTQSYAKTIEESILRHPEQWLWTHRRFKGDLSPLRENEWSQPRIRK
jgi:KDO2-lipid IV(A) lauroyltransferase